MYLTDAQLIELICTKWLKISFSWGKENKTISHPVLFRSDSTFKHSVVTSWLVWCWMHGAPQTGCALKMEHVARTRKTELPRCVISIVACCHSVKLCALAAQTLQSQQWPLLFKCSDCYMSVLAVDSQGLFYANAPAVTLSHSSPWYHGSCRTKGMTSLSIFQQYNLGSSYQGCGAVVKMTLLWLQSSCFSWVWLRLWSSLFS